MKMEIKTGPPLPSVFPKGRSTGWSKLFQNGDTPFIHGNPGHKPATTIPSSTEAMSVDLYRNKYYDVNFTHFTELLAAHEALTISPSAVASIHIFSPKATKAKKKRMKNTNAT